MMRAGAVAALLGLLLFTGGADASSSRSWADRTRETFEAGKADGVSVTGQGEVVLAPEIRILHEGDATRVWDVAIDGSGQVLAGTGGGGKLLRHDPASGVWPVLIVSARIDPSGSATIISHPGACS